MSNPAVIKLVKKKIGKYNVWLDDNIGEKIHIHINSFRVDLNYETFSELCYSLEKAINSLCKADGFDITKVDPIFVEQLLCDERCLLYDLNSIKEEEIHLSELWVGFKRIRRIKNSIYYKQLHSKKENYMMKGSDHIGQSPKERMDSCMAMVKEKGYPYDGKYVIVYGNNNIICDGQHRAICLWELNGGDMKIPIQRYFFNGYRHKNEILLSSPLAGLYRFFQGIGEKNNSLSKIKERWKARLSRVIHFPYMRRIKLLYYRIFCWGKIQKARKLIEQ